MRSYKILSQIGEKAIQFVVLTEENQNPYDYFNNVKTIWDILGLAGELIKEQNSCEADKKLLDSI